MRSRVCVCACAREALHIITDRVVGMNNTPSNNPRNADYCDACYTPIRHDECECNNNGGWGWATFHTPDEDTEGGE